MSDVLAHEKIRTAIAQGLAKLKQQGANSSGHATRALLLVEPPSVDDGEITDKGYVNQRKVLARRAALADLLYAEPPPPGVVIAAGRPA